MSSKALAFWQTTQLPSLDELEAAHRTVGGTARGRRYRTQQINNAYVLLLAAEFQRFCRSLHDEAAFHLSGAASAPSDAAILAGLTQGRELDRGNANPSSLGNDFLRIGLSPWSALEKRSKRNKARQARLEQLNTWRNAIAHHSYAWSKGQQDRISSTTATLRYVKLWRAACEALAVELDEAVADHLEALRGSRPW